MTYKEKVQELREKDSNCCQAVFCCCCDKFPISEELAWQIGAFFGGGMRRHEVCGAVTGALMGLGLKYGDLSDGAFDITVLPLRELWNFEGENPSVPEQEDIDEVCQMICRQNNLTMEQLKENYDDELKEAVVRTVNARKVLELIREAAVIS